MVEAEDFSDHPCTLQYFFRVINKCSDPGVVDPPMPPIVMPG